MLRVSVLEARVNWKSLTPTNSKMEHIDGCGSPELPKEIYRNASVTHSEK